MDRVNDAMKRKWRNGRETGRGSERDSVNYQSFGRDSRGGVLLGVDCWYSEIN